jgi:hypothetical protein
MLLLREIAGYFFVFLLRAVGGTTKKLLAISPKRVKSGSAIAPLKTVAVAMLCTETQVHAYL